MSFNLSDYETVKERKKRFYKKYPDGVIIPEIISPMGNINDYVVIKCRIWKSSPVDMKKEPDGQGNAFELAGGKGASKFAWVENCEESAVGRALDNMGFSGNNKCSREEIQSVQDAEKKTDENNTQKENSENSIIMSDFINTFLDDHKEYLNQFSGDALKEQIIYKLKEYKYATELPNDLKNPLLNRILARF